MSTAFAGTSSPGRVRRPRRAPRDTTGRVRGDRSDVEPWDVRARGDGDRHRQRVLPPHGGSVGSYTGINIVSEDMTEENHLVTSISLRSR